MSKDRQALILARQLPAPISTEGRVPPQAVDIESQVLGAMLTDREATAIVIDVLTADDFHADYHRKIYQAIVALFERSERIDTITTAEQLRKAGHLELTGGETYLVELTMKVTSSANVEQHALIVLEKSLMRRIITVGSSLNIRGFSPEEDPFVLLEDAQRELFEIAEKKQRRKFVSLHSAVHNTIEHLESVHATRGGVNGITTGFRDLDALTGGWQNTDLIIVGGRPSSGKTAFALSIARNAMFTEKPNIIGMFSIEMSQHQLVSRLIAAEAKVDAHAMRTGKLAEDDWKRISISAGKLVNGLMFIDESSTIDILQLRAKARRLKMERNITLLIVDYLQLIDAKGESREKEISRISRSLKALAKELNIPVIALSQLSRSVESRNDKRPNLSDLRESGAIEQDADVVLFVHRPEMYVDPNSDKFHEVHGQADIIIAKQRNGPIDDIKLSFIHRYARFENLATNFNAFPESQPHWQDGDIF